MTQSRSSWKGQGPTGHRVHGYRGLEQKEDSEGVKSSISGKSQENIVSIIVEMDIQGQRGKRERGGHGGSEHGLLFQDFWWRPNWFPNTILPLTPISVLSMSSFILSSPFGKPPPSRLDCLSLWAVCWLASSPSLPCFLNKTEHKLKHELNFPVL